MKPNSIQGFNDYFSIICDDIIKGGISAFDRRKRSYFVAIFTLSWAKDAVVERIQRVVKVGLLKTVVV